jgi:hypothetical protein
MDQRSPVTGRHSVVTGRSSLVMDQRSPVTGRSRLVMARLDRAIFLP